MEKDGREDVLCLKDTTNAILLDCRTKINDASNELDDSQLKSLTIFTVIGLFLGGLASVPLAAKEYSSIEIISNFTESTNPNSRQHAAVFETSSKNR